MLGTHTHELAKGKGYPRFVGSYSSSMMIILGAPYSIVTTIGTVPTMSNIDKRTLIGSYKLEECLQSGVLRITMIMGLDPHVEYYYSGEQS